MVLAQREELINQAAEKIKSITGADVGIDEAHHATSKSYRRCVEHYFENPFWLRLFQVVRKEIERDARQEVVSRNVPKAVNLLLTDSRLPIVRERLKVSRPSFGTILGILKARFGLCFQAYNAHRAFRRGLRF